MHELNPDIYSFDKSQSPRCRQHQAITATPTPGENLRAPRHNDLSGDRQTQKHHIQSKYLVPQSGVPKHGTLVNESQQIFHLGGGVEGGVNNVSSPKVSRYNSNREAAPADRKNISEMPRSVHESPLGRWIWQAMWER